MPVLVPPVIDHGGFRCLPQPTLVVDELVLRPWERSDAPRVAAAYRDPDIQRWHVREMTDEEAASWVLSWSARWLAETDASWAIATFGVLVGRLGFKQLDLVNGSAEVTYWVVPSARGQNVAARALTTATDWMFNVAGFHRMTLPHSTHNQKSCRVAEKADYAYEGTARNQGIHADGWHDMHVHARLHDEA